MSRHLHLFPLSPTWQARLAAWPGVLTLLSVLAVVLGAPVQVQMTGQRLTASNVAPVLPELRPAPQPGAAVPLAPAPPPEPFRVDARATERAGAMPYWLEPELAWDLTALGRRQTDGG